MNKKLFALLSFYGAFAITAVIQAVRVRSEENDAKRAQIARERDLDLKAVQIATDVITDRMVNGGKRYASGVELIEDTDYEIRFQKIAIREE